MHAAVRRYKVSDAEAFIGKIEESSFTDSLKGEATDSSATT